MKLMSIGQLRVAVLFFVVFFALTAAGQYIFVRRQTEGTIVRGLQEGADQVNKAVGYTNGVDLYKLNQSWISEDFAAVLNDGSVLYANFYKGAVPAGLLPRVECPVLARAILERPTTVSYTNGAKQAEKWLLFAKRLDHGYWIFGFSEYDSVENPSEVLSHDLSLIGSTLQSAKSTSTEEFNYQVSWILFDDSGNLVSASGRIPLKTDPMQIGKLSRESPYRTLGSQPYYVLYSPITDPTGTPVGMVVLPAEVKQTSIAVSNLLYFSLTVGVVSVLIFLALAALYYRNKEKEKLQIRQAFQHYFSPQILDSILQDPARLRLGGQRREITVLFSDIRSFTSIAEALAPHQLIQLMQQYFSEMTAAVFSTHGVVDKYIGDALMAFWGAPIEQPDQADRAVMSAMDMMVRLRRLHEKWKDDNLPQLEIGIGINLGVATVGNFGSAERFDYTAIGDTVNAASRLEALNKEYNSHIIISDSTLAQVTMKLETRDLGELKIRGKQKSLRAFEVLVP